VGLERHSREVFGKVSEQDMLQTRCLCCSSTKRYCLYTKGSI